MTGRRLSTVALDAQTSLAAARIVIRHVGLRRGLAVLVEVGRASARGEPFRPSVRAGVSAGPVGRSRSERGVGNASANDEAEQEALSRKQIGPAILLYRALGRRVGKDSALAITSEVVDAGALLFLSHSLGRLDLDFAAARTDEDRRLLVRRLGTRFPNATMQLDELSTEHVRFSVTHCRFPPLCADAGAPELAPLFCQADAVYFGTVLDTVELVRPHTIAGGAESCPFELRLRRAQPLRPTSR